MSDPFDYLVWRGDITINQDGFNEVDNIILALVSYIDFKNFIPAHPLVKKIKFKTACDHLFKVYPKDKMELGLIVPHDIVELTYEASRVNRFKDLYVSNMIDIIDEEREMQFAAMVFHLDDDTIYVSYRGTDDTLIGWQENLNLIVKFPVPAEIEAAKYLNEVASIYKDKKIYVGGQSKGGNLAVYAAIYCDDEIKDRIIEVYNNDGPGFEGPIDKDKFNLVKDKIIRIMPNNSIVGMMLKPYRGKDIIVKSVNKGVYQHNSVSWQVIGNKFETVDKLVQNSHNIEKAVQRTVDDLSYDERINLVEDTYNLIRNTNKKKLMEMTAINLNTLRAAKGYQNKNKRIFLHLFFTLQIYGAFQLNPEPNKKKRNKYPKK